MVQSDRESKYNMLKEVYSLMFDRFGRQHWWPGESILEMMVGAVLTQMVSWTNVEKAIENLKANDLLSVDRLLDVDNDILKELIRPSGYFNRKAETIKRLMSLLSERYGGDANLISKSEPRSLRNELLAVEGIGKETADSIILYGASKPLFVIDAYTMRIFTRLGIIKGKQSYDSVQGLFMKNLPEDAALYNEYHALIVRLGKEYCKKGNPSCMQCPLSPICRYRMDNGDTDA